MTNIKAVSFTPNTFVDSKKEANVRKYELVENPQAINKSLLALAAIGLATLSSCSHPIDIEYEDMNPKPTEIMGSKGAPYTKRVSTSERLDSIFNALGILKSDSASIKNVTTINAIDDNNTQYWIKPNRISNNVVYGQGLTILPDWSEGSNYVFNAKASQNGGVDVTKTYKDGTTSTYNYKLNNDGTVTEYLVVDNGYMLENSVYEKQNDGKIVKTFSNGEKCVYDKIGNNNEYPTEISFDAGVSDWETDNI
ncbi:hypothetical protein J6O48_00640 [bacterium]|nr:hypothetical protein [bacterium]